MSSELARIVRTEGVVPLAWAGGAVPSDALNLGDALSPVMVALLSGRPVRRVPAWSGQPRLAAVGTIGQTIAGGDVWFWGTGCGAIQGVPPNRIRFSPDPDMRAWFAATRGPLSATLLGGGRLVTRTFGDPVWLLPRFHSPPVEKRWDLGVILHLSELAQRSPAAGPNPRLSRYQIPAEFAGRIRLINTLTPPSLTGLQAKLDEIRSCRRVLSTSLHGLVIAESYGIPCLPLAHRPKAGLMRVELTADARLDPRILDLYMGAGRATQAVWGQPGAASTDWAALIGAVDTAWEPATIDETALIDSFPLDLALREMPPGGRLCDHPVVKGLDYAHDAGTVQREDAAAAASAVDAEATARTAWTARLTAWRLPTVLSRPRQPPPPQLVRTDQGVTVPLAWADAPTAAVRFNLGDALSPVIVAAITGLPVRHIGFNSTCERLVAVGTIGHAQRRGIVHFWGAGLDAAINPDAPEMPWAPPADTVFHVHAMRGPLSAGLLRRYGVDAPEVFGDPVYLLDRLFPLGNVEKTHDLGVVLHLSELTGDPARVDCPPAVEPRMTRYHVPAAFAGRVKLIDTFVRPSLGAMHAKLREIASCRAILSTSLHGLVIADVYGIPNAWFGFGETALRTVDPLDHNRPMDHRMRDLYAGQGLTQVPIVTSWRNKPSDWDRLIGLMGEVAPRSVDVKRLFDGFPGPRAVSWDETLWPQPHGLVPRL